MSYKTGEAASLAKVSIKTLHHYDAIGLLVPTGRSESGYRLYSAVDLMRLQQILFYRELKFSLDEILVIMTAPDFDYLRALKSQKTLLQDKRENLTDIINLIEKTIHSSEEDKSMSMKEMFEVFPEVDEEMMEEEERRWGHTEQHRDSMHRAKKYSKKDWEDMKVERDALYEEISALFKNDVKADDPRVLKVVDKQRLMIEKWHYPCSREFYVNLTEMTSMDEKFVDYIDQDFPGLARYIHEAAKINARG